MAGVGDADVTPIRTVRGELYRIDHRERRGSNVSVGRGAHLTHDVGVGGASTWTLHGADGACLAEVRADVGRLHERDLADLVATLERIAARRQLRAL